MRYEQVCAHIPQTPLGPLSLLHAERTELPLQPLSGLDPSPILTFLGQPQNQLQEELNLVEDLGDTDTSSRYLTYFGLSQLCVGSCGEMTQGLLVTFSSPWRWHGLLESSVLGISSFYFLTST